MIRNLFSKMEIEGVEALAEVFREFGIRKKIMKQWSGAKCLKVLKNPERCENRKRHGIMVVDTSTCRAIEGVWWSVKSMNRMSANAQGHVGRWKFNPKAFSLNKSQLKAGGLVYRPGHRLWWRAWHVTVWGVLSRTRGQVRNEWFRSEHSRRFMELAFYSEHGRLSPGLCVIDVTDNGRSGGLTSPQEAHRRISQ